MESPLQKAAAAGRQSVCEWLLAPGAGLGVKHLIPDSEGNTPRSDRVETRGERIDAEARRRAMSRRVGDVRVGRRAAVRPSFRAVEDGGYRGENAIGGVS